MANPEVFIIISKLFRYCEYLGYFKYLVFGHILVDTSIEILAMVLTLLDFSLKMYNTFTNKKYIWSVEKEFTIKSIITYFAKHYKKVNNRTYI